jgi:hypothetical protein
MREKADFGCDEPIGALVLVIEPVGSRFSNFVTGGPHGELRRSHLLLRIVVLANPIEDGPRKWEIVFERINGGSATGWFGARASHTLASLWDEFQYQVGPAVRHSQPRIAGVVVEADLVRTGAGSAG